MLSKDTEMGDNEAMLARTAALLLSEWLAAWSVVLKPRSLERSNQGTWH